MTAPKATFDEVVAKKVSNDLLRDQVQVLWTHVPSFAQQECADIVRKRGKTIGESTLVEDVRLHMRITTAIGAPLVTLTPRHMEDLHGRNQWTSIDGGASPWVGETKRRDLRRLIKILAVPYRGQDRRLGAKEAEAKAKALVAPKGRIPYDGTKSQPRTVRRLTRMQRDDLLALVTREDDGTYEAAVHEFLIRLADATGGRFGGHLAKRTAGDIRNGVDGPSHLHSGLGYRNKRRTMWRLGHAQGALRKVILRHPQRKPDAAEADVANLLDAATYLMLDPGRLRNGECVPIQASTLRVMWRRYGTALKLPFALGPKAFRRFCSTRNAVAGYRPDKMRRTMAHGSGSDSREHYTQIDLHDVEELGDRTGWAPPDTATYCQCNRRLGTHEATCLRCGTPAEAAIDPILQPAAWRHEAHGRLGLSVYEAMIGRGEDVHG